VCRSQHTEKANLALGSPQEKLKEALRIIGELSVSLSHTTASNLSLREPARSLGAIPLLKGVPAAASRAHSQRSHGSASSMGFSVEPHKPSFMDRFR
jgi:hypothetical protein